MSLDLQSVSIRLAFENRDQSKFSSFSKFISLNLFFLESCLFSFHYQPAGSSRPWGFQSPARTRGAAPLWRKVTLHRHRASPGGQPVPPGGQWRLLHLPMLVLSSSRWLAAGVTHTAGGRRAQPPSFSLPFGGVSSTRLTHSSNLSLQLTGGAHVSTSGEQNSPQPPPSALVPGHLWISSSASRISAHMRRARWGPAASLDFGWERSPSPGPGPGTDQTRNPRESRPGDGVDSATVGLFQAIHQEAGGGVLQDGRDVPEQDPPLPLPRVSWARGAGSSLNFNLSEN